EYEARLLHGEVTGLKPVADDDLATIRAAAADSVSFGWRYIPGPRPAPDLDQPVLLRAQYDWSAAWRGEGSATFDTAGAEAAPYSGHIVAALAGCRWSSAGPPP